MKENKSRESISDRYVEHIRDMNTLFHPLDRTRASAQQIDNIRSTISFARAASSLSSRHDSFQNSWPQVSRPFPMVDVGTSSAKRPP